MCWSPAARPGDCFPETSQSWCDKLNPPRQLRHVFLYRPLLEKVSAGSLHAAHRAAELRHKEACFQTLAERPAGFLTPQAGKQQIFPYDVANLTGNFDGDALPRQRCRQISPRRPAISIKADQR